VTSTTHKENRRGRKNMQDVQVVGTCPSRQQTGREQRLVRRAASHLREALRTRQVYQGRGDQLPLLGRLRRLNRMPCPSLEQETPAWGQHGSRTQAGTITSQPTAARPGIPRPAASMRARWAFIFPDLPLSCGEAWLQ